MTRSTSSPLAVPDADEGQDRSGDGLGEAERQRAQRLLIAFARLGAAVTAALQARVGTGAVSNVQILVLTSLDLSGPQRPADIIALTGMTSGGVTKVLDRLEEQGLIARRYGGIEGDRRGTQLMLTPKGEQMATGLAAGIASQMDAVRDVVAELRSVIGD